MRVFNLEKVYNTLYIGNNSGKIPKGGGDEFLLGSRHSINTSYSCLLVKDFH